MCKTCNAEEMRQKAKLESAIAHYSRAYKVNNYLTLHILSHYEGKPFATTDEQLHELLSVLEEVSQLNPYNGGKVDVVYPYTLNDAAYATTWNQSADKYVTLTPMVFDKNAEDYERHAPMPGFMPAYVNNSNISLLRYSLFHEWGHVTDPMLPDGDHLSDERFQHMQYLAFTRLLDSNLFAVTMSQYGMTGDPEANAEAHAEYFLTRGKTTNYAAQVFAHENKWKIPNKN